MRNNSRKNYRRRNTGASQIKLVGIVAVIVVIAIIIVISCFNKTKKNSNKAKNTGTATENVTGVTEQVSETEEAKELFVPKESDATAAIGDELESSYAVVIDEQDGTVVAGKNAHEKMYPASMTKVMTLIVAVEQLQDLNQTYALSYELLDPLVREQASRAGFDPGEMVTAKDYLYGLVLPSGADAAVALSIMTAGSEEAFADLMNQKCSEIGLKNTHFMNASGLYDEQQYTTPVEMAMIMQYAMQNPTCAEVLSTYQYTTTPTAQHPEGIKLSSTMFSRMYGNEVENVTIMAGKTGYTQEAGNCLVSYAQKNGHHYVALTAGASYKWHVIFDDFEIYKTYLP